MYRQKILNFSSFRIFIFIILIPIEFLTSFIALEMSNSNDHNELKAKENNFFYFLFIYSAKFSAVLNFLISFVLLSFPLQLWLVHDDGEKHTKSELNEKSEFVFLFICLFFSFIFLLRSSKRYTL
jgi:hypothetical protein